MGILELLSLAVGLSMDAFAVAVCKGLAIKKLKLSQILTVGLWFGGFQALMPYLGWLLASRFSGYIESFDHWIAFALLLLIGGGMIKEALSGEEATQDASLGFYKMFTLAVATSIDAMAAGIVFTCNMPNFLSPSLSPYSVIFFSVLVIGLTTFIISVIGVKIGNIFGEKYKSKAELFGGAVLILLGIKILLNGLGIISF